MKLKRRSMIILIILLVFLVLSIFGIYELSIKSNKKSSLDIDVNTSLNIPKEQMQYLQSLVGLESKNIKILDNPLRIEGSFYIPEETILTFINHYLESSNNKDITNLNITINENALTISGQYKLLTYLKTPIDIDILPTITKEKNLRLNLKDIRLLNLSLNENIIDAVIDSWFSDLENISVDRGDVIIDKSFFKNTEIKSMDLKEDYLVIDLSLKIQ
ncbi:MAG: hypothetical protein PUJ51_05925 [Clostridiales bacterium]|uniref:hypothetical protein n=1 Tax=Terrisporobacter sp. TaxID=1965305 RepID=UPI002A578FF8|nr:hypothetical protein [Terrisporobacter sp.]MDD7754029.1 hypothetical protein [Clostridiales bacterium]MDY4135836.1 hypothetical protein [Terrisporobacter sp.]